MKRLLLILFAFLPLFAFAQHLSFMGIPINGSVNTFASKLQAKGFKISAKNKAQPVGRKWMSGTFYGDKADIIIFYTPTNKNVYTVKVLFNEQPKSVAIQTYKEIVSNLSYKYNVVDEPMTNDEIEEGVSLYTFKNDDISDKCIGVICAYYQSFNPDYYPDEMKEYNVILEYVDLENNFNNQNTKTKDL